MACGKKITNLRQLKKLVVEKKAVVCPKVQAWRNRIPAAFMIQQQGAILVQLFDTGMFVYEANNN